MVLPQLCPSTKNQLGTGFFTPEYEQSLLADGYIFACRVPNTRVETIICSKRPIQDAVTDAEIDARQMRLGIRLCDPS